MIDYEQDTGSSAEEHQVYECMNRPPAWRQSWCWREVFIEVLENSGQTAL